MRHHFSMASRFKLILGAFAALAVFAVVFFSSDPRPAGESVPDNGDSAGADQRAFPGNAFVRELPRAAPEERKPRASVVPSGGIQVPNEAVEGDPLQAIERVREIVSIPSNVEIDNKEILPLPPVPDSELAVSRDGASDLAEYWTQLSASTGTTDFPHQEYLQFSKKINGDSYLFLSPDALVGIALRDGNLSGIHDGLAVFEQYLPKKIERLRMLKVSGDMVETNRVNIAFDRLTIDLIKKAFAAEQGKVSQQELREFHAQYQKTADYYHQRNWGRYMTFAAAGKKGLFHRMADFMGLSRVVLAASWLPTGGKGINLSRTPVAYCSCSGEAVFIGPPVSAEVLFTYDFLSSPPFHINKNISTGSWILGLYVPGSAACSSPRWFGCDYEGQLGRMILSGTS